MAIFDNWRRKSEPEVIQEITQVESEEITSLKQDLYNTLITNQNHKKEIIASHKKTINKLQQDEDSISKKTVFDWRQAIQAARMIDYPNRWYLLDLYAEVKLDPFLDAIIKFQKDKLKSITRKVSNVDGTINEGYTKLFNSTWTDQLISGVVESQLQGFCLLEIDEIIKDRGILNINKLSNIPSKNVIPEKQMLKKQQQGSQGDYSYKNNDWIIELVYDNERNLGSLSKLSPYVLYKRVAIQSWSGFIEKYGVPGIIMKTAVRDREKDAELYRQMKSIGSEFVGILDDEDDLEIFQPQSADIYQSFKELNDLVDKTIANEIIGGSSLFTGSENGSSYALSQTHLEISDVKTKSDVREIERFINNILIDKFKRLGIIEQSADIYFEFILEDQIGTMQKAEIFARVAPFMNVNPDYVEKEFKINIDGIKEQPDKGTE